MSIRPRSGKDGPYFFIHTHYFGHSVFLMLPSGQPVYTCYCRYTLSFCILCSYVVYHKLPICHFVLPTSYFALHFVFYVPMWFIMYSAFTTSYFVLHNPYFQFRISHFILYPMFLCGLLYIPHSPIRTSHFVFRTSFVFYVH